MRNEIKIERSRALDPFEIKLNERLMNYLIKRKEMFFMFLVFNGIRKLKLKLKETLILSYF